MQRSTEVLALLWLPRVPLQRVSTILRPHPRRYAALLAVARAILYNNRRTKAVSLYGVAQNLAIERNKNFVENSKEIYAALPLGGF